MKKFTSDQSGFSIVTVLVAVAVVGIIAFAGYRVVNRNSTASNSGSTAAVQAKAPAAIKSKQDVRQAAKALDADQGDKQLDPKQLDSALSSLL